MDAERAMAHLENPTRLRWTKNWLKDGLAFVHRFLADLKKDASLKAIQSLTSRSSHHFAHSMRLSLAYDAQNLTFLVRLLNLGLGGPQI